MEEMQLKMEDEIEEYDVVTITCWSPSRVISESYGKFKSLHSIPIRDVSFAECYRNDVELYKRP